MMLRLILYLTFALLTTRRSTRSNHQMTTDTTDTDRIIAHVADENLGDVVNTNENPVLQPEADAVDTIDVLINTTHARRPNGHHPIRVYIPENATLTAAQAHQLHIDLETASRVVADIRRDAGYGS